MIALLDHAVFCYAGLKPRQADPTQRVSFLRDLGPNRDQVDARHCRYHPTSPPFLLNM